MLPLLLKCHTKLLVNKIPTSRFTVRHLQYHSKKSISFIPQHKTITEIQSKWEPFTILSRTKKTKANADVEPIVEDGILRILFHPSSHAVANIESKPETTETIPRTKKAKSKAPMDPTTQEGK